MYLIVGLGNPGKKYEKTRHNLGFAVVDALLQELAPAEKTVWRQQRRSNSLVVRVADLLLAKPQTMMNASGFAVAKLVKRVGLETDHLWVIHDDLDLPLGKIKIRKGGGSAGHRGVESIIKQLGTEEFIRFRLGIGHPKREEGFQGERLIERYVLSPFSQGEKHQAKKMIKKAVEAIKVALEKGIESAMNSFNV